MKRSSVFAALFALTCVLPALGNSGPKPWSTGRLVSTQIEGNASGLVNKNPKLSPKRDLWWSYRICTPEATYDAVSRQNLRASGITVGDLVLFRADPLRITLLNPCGANYILRIVRQGKKSACGS